MCLGERCMRLKKCLWLLRLLDNRMNVDGNYPDSSLNGNVDRSLNFVQMKTKPFQAFHRPTNDLRRVSERHIRRFARDHRNHDAGEGLAVVTALN